MTERGACTVCGQAFRDGPHDTVEACDRRNLELATTPGEDWQHPSCPRPFEHHPFAPDRERVATHRRAVA